MGIWGQAALYYKVYVCFTTHSCNHFSLRSQIMQHILPMAAHQGPERQQQVQQGVQHSLEDEPAARRMTLQEMRDASFAAAGLCPKVPMKVS